MKRLLCSMLACAVLTGCGLGETASSVATGTATEAEQARQATQTEAQIKQQLDAAAKLDAERRAAADAAAQ
jgi:hypothetical protein